jgi:hypothetical protein
LEELTCPFKIERPIIIRATKVALKAALLGRTNNQSQAGRKPKLVRPELVLDPGLELADCEGLDLSQEAKSVRVLLRNTLLV